MDSVKPIIASKTIIAAVVGGLAALLSLGGVVLSADQVASLSDNAYTVTVAVCNLVGIASCVVAAVQRKRATAQIGGVFTANPANVPDPASLVSSLTNASVNAAVASGRVIYKL